MWLQRFTAAAGASVVAIVIVVACVSCDDGGYVDSNEKAARLARRVQRAPDDAAAWKELGYLHLLAEKWPEAVTATTRAVELAPQDARAHYNHGQALKRVGSLADATRAYERSVALDPTFSHANAGLAWAYKATERWDDAIRVYQEGLPLTQDRFTYFELLGEAHYRKGDVAGAVRWCEKIVAPNPTNASFHDRLGRAYSRFGRDDAAMMARAADAFIKATELAPRYARYHFHAGEALLLAGREADAGAHFERSLVLAAEGAQLSEDDHATATRHVAELKQR